MGQNRVPRPTKFVYATEVEHAAPADGEAPGVPSQPACVTPTARIMSRYDPLRTASRRVVEERATMLRCLGSGRWIWAKGPSDHSDCLGLIEVSVTWNQKKWNQRKAGVTRQPHCLE